MKRLNQRLSVRLFTVTFAFLLGYFITSVLIAGEKCISDENEAYEVNLAPLPEYFLVILILSTPSGVGRRNTIRETWVNLGQPLTLPAYPLKYIYMPRYDEQGHLKMPTVIDQSLRLASYIKWKDGEEKLFTPARVRNIRVKHFFAVGTKSLKAKVIAKLQREQRDFDDMLLLPDLYDTRSDLTEKVLQSLKALTGDYKFNYLLKVDDDTYVKLDELLNDLVSYDRKRYLWEIMNYQRYPWPELYWGYFTGHEYVKRTGKFAEMNYFLTSHYVCYAQGRGYVISRRISELLVAHAQTLPRYMRDDVSLGTWLAPYRIIYRRHDPRFNVNNITRECPDYHLVLHKSGDLQLMKDMYQGRWCNTSKSDAQITSPLAYFYNWHMRAHKCCDTLLYSWKNMRRPTSVVVL